MYELRNKTKSPVRASKRRSFGNSDDAEGLHAGMGVLHEKEPFKAIPGVDV